MVDAWTGSCKTALHVYVVHVYHKAWFEDSGSKNAFISRFPWDRYALIYRARFNFRVFFLSSLICVWFRSSNLRYAFRPACTPTAWFHHSLQNQSLIYALLRTHDIHACNNKKPLKNMLMITCKRRHTMHTGYGRAASVAEGFQNSKF